MKTAVLQSHRRDCLDGWMGRCIESVASWAQALGADYQLIHDELFDYVPAGLKSHIGHQTVVASDIARLAWLQEMLSQGYERVIWCDADLLIFRYFEPHDSSHAFGREVWVQLKDGRPRAYRKIHNAYMAFTAESPVLGFYRESAERLLAKARMPVVPQFVGPKLLTALDNLVGFAVEERVGMLSPLALQTYKNGGGDAIDLTLDGHKEKPCAFNLSASYMGKASDGVCNQTEDYHAVINALLA